MPELGGDYTLDTILEEMQKSGYSGTEIGNKFPKEASSIKEVLSKYKLELASAWHSTFFLSKTIDDELEKIHKKASLLADSGAVIINIAECTGSVHGTMQNPLSSKPVCSEKDWDILTSSLDKAGEICSSYGVSIAYHHHMGTYIQSEKEIFKLLSSTDPKLVNLCADTGHLFFAGVDPVKFFEKNMNQIRHIHFKDLRPDVFYDMNFEQVSFLKAVLSGVFTVPGDGCIDFEAISRSINMSKYNGWIIVEAEQDPSKANPFEYAMRSRKHLNKIWSN